MTVQQTAYEEALRSGDPDRIFYEMVHHPTMPLTDAELSRLIALRPERWGTYAEYIGLLDDQAHDRNLAASSGLGRQLA